VPKTLIFAKDDSHADDIVQIVHRFILFFLLLAVAASAAPSQSRRMKPSCVVFGMPREAIARGATDFVLPLEQIARQALDSLNTDKTHRDRLQSRSSRCRFGNGIPEAKLQSILQ